MIRSIVTAAAAALLSLNLAAAEAAPVNADEVLAAASFHRVKVLVGTPEHGVFGSGVWLGNGKVLTANHLFFGYKKGDPIHVVIDRQTVAASVRAQGDLQSADLALLDLIPSSTPVTSWQGPAICTSPVPVGAPLQVISYDHDFNTYASPEAAVFHQRASWSEATTATFSPGVSGSPVFDPSTGCLAGIISRRQVSKTLVGDQLDEQEKCVQATRRDEPFALTVTCSVSAPTYFSSLEGLRAFLTAAGLSLSERK